MLRMLQFLALGEANTKATAGLPDLTQKELVPVIPLAILVLWMGLYPGPLMEMVDSSVTHLVGQMAPYQSRLTALPVVR